MTLAIVGLGALFLAAAGCKKPDSSSAADAEPVVDAAVAALDPPASAASAPLPAAGDPDKLPGAFFEDVTAKKAIHPDNYKQELEKVTVEAHSL